MNIHTVPPEIARRVGLDNIDLTGLEGDRRLADLAANEAAEKAGSAHSPRASASLRTLVDIENLIDAAHDELQIVDYLIEMGKNDLAYRATSAVFDKLDKVRAITRKAGDKERAI